MTVDKLRRLPIGTRVVWNRKGVSQGDEGEIAEEKSGERYIRWDDGQRLTVSKGIRWVKRI